MSAKNVSFYGFTNGSGKKIFFERFDKFLSQMFALNEAIFGYSGKKIAPPPFPLLNGPAIKTKTIFVQFSSL